MLFSIIILVLISTSFGSPMLMDLGIVQSLERRNDDPCANMYTAPNGMDRFDCTRINVVDKDNNCPVATNDLKTECKKYCEVRRTAWLGDETTLVLSNGVTNRIPPGQLPTLQGGLEFSIAKSLSAVPSLGVLGDLEKAFAFGVDFPMVTSKTTTTTAQLTDELSNEYYSSWVAFPIFMSTCGTLTEKTSVTNYGKGGLTAQYCGGTQKTTINSCSTVAYTGSSGSTPKTIFALRKYDHQLNTGQ
jgi:hypothetical protein